MNAREQGFLLLTSQLGAPERRPLTVPQFRVLAGRVRELRQPGEDREITAEDIAALGYGDEMTGRILGLLSDRELLEYYLMKGRREHCQPITRVSDGYPLRLRKRLGEESPGCLWAKGDLSLLTCPCVSLVGSRELGSDNRRFAQSVGIWAAEHGFVLVSGNARGADKAAQEACLAAGGRVICVVADELTRQSGERILCLSEDSFDAPFSSQRALSRNRVIHCLGDCVFVAQTRMGSGGTWHGTAQNLRWGWSKVFCFDDGSPGAQALMALGAEGISGNIPETLPPYENPFRIEV